MSATSDAEAKAVGAVTGAMREALDDVITAVQADSQAEITDLTTQLAASEQQNVVLTAQGAQDAQDLAADKDTISTLEAQHASDAANVGQLQAQAVKDAATITDLRTQVAALTPHTTLAGMSFGGNADPSVIEQLAGKPLGIQRLYYQASEVAKCTANIATAGAAGRKVVWASFKLPASWADMGAGKQDAWVKDMGAKVSGAAVAAKVQVWLTLHHEPEGDFPLVDFQAMNKHCLPQLGGLPNVSRWIIATGYPQIFGGGNSAWTLDAMYPGDGLLEGVGVDPYLTNGMYQTTYGVGTPISSWTDPATAYYPTFASFAKGKGIRWAVAETGITDPAFLTPPAGKDGPGWMAADFAAAVKLGAVGWCYFDSFLNSRGYWATDKTPAKRKALAAVIAAA